jgi:ERCC4-related helicase
MKKIAVGWSLSFDNAFPGDVAAALDEACRFKPEKNKFYIQAPKLALINSVLSQHGFEIDLDKDGQKQYHQLELVKATFDPVTKSFKIRFSDYPSWPHFTGNDKKRNQWLNVSKRVDKDSGHVVYEIKHTYQLIDGIEWLKREGFVVDVAGSISPFLPPGDPGAAVIASAKRSDSLVLKKHQEECAADMEKMGYRAIDGSSAGLGKTINAGEAIFKLFNLGKARRVLWVVPTSPLVKQVRDEMSSRYGIDGLAVTGAIAKPKDRLGDKGTGKTVYEKGGFVIMTWSMLVKDFAGKNYYEITKRVHFDVVILDEGHRCQLGNVARDAALNLTAPFRIILSGTIMPNGDWRELHSLVSTIAPASIMAPWVFAGIEANKEEELKHDRKIEDPRQEARKIVTRMVLAMLMPFITRHTIEECAGFLPKLVETRVHVDTNDRENEIIEIMINMLSGIIEKWQPVAYLKFGKASPEKEHAMLLDNAKNIVWQDLRRFCSHGAFRLQQRVEDVLKGKSPIHKWLQENYDDKLKAIRQCMRSGSVRPQPKNEKVIEVLDKIKPERCLIFCNSVIGCIELGKFLSNEGMSTRVVVGSDDQMTDEDAEEIGQSNNIDDEELERIIEWFWFPWFTVSRFSSVDKDISVTYEGQDGVKRDKVYYVDGHKLGKRITIVMEWDKHVDHGSFVEVSKLIDSLQSPSIVLDAEVPANFPRNVRPRGRIIVSIQLTSKPDNRVLVTTDKLNEGVNLQIANTVVFYDCPLSIKQNEQRIARLRRMESSHASVALVKLLEGLDYAIERSIARKYETASQLGYSDSSPVSMKEVLQMIKKKKGSKAIDLMDFAGKETK